MDSGIVELGVGGLFAIQVIKTVLPYLKPAKNKDIIEAMKPVQDRQLALLERMNERELECHSKVCSNHDTLKTISLEVHDARGSIDAVHKRMDRVNFGSSTA